MINNVTQQPIAPIEVGGCDKWASLVEQYGWEKPIAKAVMEAESHCHTDSVGDTWVIGDIYAPSCGLYQIRTLPGRPNCEQLKDPEFNVKYAYGLYQAHGWQPWSAYNSGAYQKFLK